MQIIVSFLETSISQTHYCLGVYTRLDCNLRC